VVCIFTMLWLTRLVLRHGSITLIVIGVEITVLKLIVIGVEITVLKLPSLATIDT